jgi:hypothetical protein
VILDSIDVSILPGKLRSNLHICFETVGFEPIEHVQNHAAELEKFGISYCLQFFPGVIFSDEKVIGAIAKMKNSLRIDAREDFINHNRNLVGQKNLKVLQSPYLEHYPSWLEEEVDEGGFGYLGYGISLSSWHMGHYHLPVYKKLTLLNTDSILSFLPTKARYWKSAKLLGDGVMHNLIYGEFRSDEKKNQVLWAPHWTQTWFGSERGYSRFIDAIDPFLRFLAASPENSVSFRPHPILLQAIEVVTGIGSSTNREVLATANFLKPFEIEIRRLLDSPKLRISKQSLARDVLTHSSLVTDGVSIIGYWGATGKPMAIWIDNDSPKFNFAGKFLTLLFSKVSNPKELSVWLVGEKTPRRFSPLFTRRIIKSLFAVSKQPPIIKMIKYL